MGPPFTRLHVNSNPCEGRHRVLRGRPEKERCFRRGNADCDDADQAYPGLRPASRDVTVRTIRRIANRPIIGSPKRIATPDESGDHPRTHDASFRPTNPRATASRSWRPRSLSFAQISANSALVESCGSRAMEPPAEPQSPQPPVFTVFLSLFRVLCRPCLLSPAQSGS